MRKNLLLLGLLTLFVISCSDQTTVFAVPEDDISLESDSEVLKNSVDYSESGLVDIFTDETAKGYSKAKPGSEDNYPLALVASIDAPSFDGFDQLGASHVDLVGNTVYICYNTAGPVYAGALDIVDISDFHNPVLNSRLYYNNADINAIKYDDGHVYFVGGVDAEQSVTATANSFIGKIAVVNGELDISNGVEYGFQEGFVANDIHINNNGVFVTSGSNGYVTHFDKNSLEILNDAAYADLRSVAGTGQNLAILDADYGVRLLDETLQETGGFAVSADFREADKRTLSVYGNKVAVAEGNGGAGIYDMQSGNFLQNLPIMLNPEGVESGDIVTNAVAFNDDVFLMANGGAGLALSENESDLNLVGVLGLSGSINYVASFDDYILAASGRRGLQIVKMNRTPSSLAAACAGLPGYSGNNRLNVPVNEEESYSGSRYFRELSVAGDLLLCGTWGVREDIYVYDEALFEMRGYLYVGRNSQRKSIVVEAGATLRIEGYLIIYGDLILEENARIEFVGNSNAAYIFGDVDADPTAQISGTFNDVYDKFD